MKLNRIYIPVIVAAMTFSCAGDTDPAGDEGMNLEEMPEEVVEEEPKKVVYYATPSLVEVASIMKNSGATFSSDLLNDVENSQNYTTHYKQALNLGVYGADLAYSAMFEETQNAINYLKTVKALTDELGMDGAFEADLLSLIESNIEDRDALLDIISEFYWSADAYLTDNERPEVAALVITGGWVESMHIACDMAARSPENQEIRDRIIEQKLILKNLLLYLNASAGTDSEVQESITMLKELQEIYNDVEITHSSGETSTDADNQSTVIGNETDLTFDQTHLDALCAKIEEIRNGYIE